MAWYHHLILEDTNYLEFTSLFSGLAFKVGIGQEEKVTGGTPQKNLKSLHVLAERSAQRQ